MNEVNLAIASLDKLGLHFLMGPNYVELQKPQEAAFFIVNSQTGEVVYAQATSSIMVAPAIKNYRTLTSKLDQGLLYEPWLEWVGYSMEHRYLAIGTFDCRNEIHSQVVVLQTQRSTPFYAICVLQKQSFIPSFSNYEFHFSNRPLEVFITKYYEDQEKHVQAIQIEGKSSMLESKYSILERFRRLVYRKSSENTDTGQLERVIYADLLTEETFDFETGFEAWYAEWVRRVAAILHVCEEEVPRVLSGALQERRSRINLH